MDYRLKKKKDFDEVFGKGKRARTRTALMLYVPANEFRFGISVGKKNGKAVERNRIKRLFRAAVIPFREKMKPCHVVFVPRSGEKIDFDSVRKDVGFLFEKERLFL